MALIKGLDCLRNQYAEVLLLTGFSLARATSSEPQNKLS